jgi:epoxyqueuosine reductase QueG
MTGEILEKAAAAFIASDANTVLPEKALRPHIAGMRIYETPIFGFASAQDEYLLYLSNSPKAGISPMPPQDWLDCAETIISFFLPFREEIRTSNRGGPYPSAEWLNGRIDGQSVNENLCRCLQKTLEEAGYAAVVPSLDERFWSKALPPENGGPLYTSNWSERHAAYACGLGTFSLSKGLITEKGVAGRFGSIITSLKLPVTIRPYRGLDNYCTKCGTCLRNCPANAITIERGKDHVPCSRFLNKVLAENKPYYGCGKCQTAVPCESRIPQPR